MTLARLAEVLEPAAADGVAVGAFNVFSLEHAEALVAGAELAGLPVVLQISENAVRYHRGLAPIAAATLSLARSARVPAVLHLDHATDLDLVAESFDLGFTSVMYDGSALDHAANLASTVRVVADAHARGIDVEAELGEVGGKDGVHAPGVRTDPAEAAAFVEQTGVDALAVAVGSSHAMTERTAALDLELVTRLHAAVPVPLVLHGSSGVPDDEIVRAVVAGMTKINIATHLNQLFTDEIRARLAADPRLVDSRKYLGPARDVVAGEVARLLRMLRRVDGPVHADATATP